MFCCVASWTEVDLFVPSFPEMLQSFQTTPEILELTLSINFLGFFLSALFAGPLADSYGRRKPIIFGNALFTLGSLICLCSSTMNGVLLGRFIQGFGVGLPAVILYAVLADLYRGEKQITMIGYFNAITSASMAFAPIIGSYLNLYFGWQANFSAILFMSFSSTVVLMLYLPETLEKANYKPFGLKQILKEYSYVIRNATGNFYNLGHAASVAAYIVFVANTPLFFMEELKMPLSHFGFYQAAVILSYSVPSFFNTLLIQRFGERFCLYLSATLAFLGAIALVLCSILAPTSALLITISMMICSAGMVFPSSLLYVYYMNLFPEHKGSAAGLFLGSRLFAQGIATAIAGWSYHGDFIGVGFIIFVTMSISAFVCYRTATKL